MTPELKPKEEREKKKNNKRLQFLQEDGTFLGSLKGGWTGIAVLPDGSLVACSEFKDFVDLLS